VVTAANDPEIETWRCQGNVGAVYAGPDRAIAGEDDTAPNGLTAETG
jgi:hypothetical protein